MSLTYPSDEETAETGFDDCTNPFSSDPFHQEAKYDDPDPDAQPVDTTPFDLPDYPEEDDDLPMEDQVTSHLTEIPTIKPMKKTRFGNPESWMSPGSIYEAVKDQLGRTGLDQDTIAKRILTCDDPDAEASAIFAEARLVINQMSTGSTNSELKDEFKAAMTDLIDGLNAKKKFKKTCAKIGEGIGDFIFSTPDLVCGIHQHILEKSPGYRRAGSWIAKTINTQKTKQGAKNSISTMERLRRKGKEVRANRRIGG